MIATLEHVGEIGDVARTSGARYRLARPVEGLGDLEQLGRRLGAHQLWVHPSWSLAHPEVSMGLCAACSSPAGKNAAGADGRRPRHRHWLYPEHKGPGASVGERDSVSSANVAPSIALVHGDPNLPRAFADTRDGGELLALVERTAYLLGEPWHGTAGATGVALLRDRLRGAGHQLEPLPPELRRMPIEPDFGWQRPLTEAERGRRWLYCFDKHNMYLTAAQTVALGAGAVQFRSAPAFVARQPGYWHVKLGAWPDNHPLPDPTRARARARAGEAKNGEYRWLTTPSVEAALAAGTLEAIAAVWYWPTHGCYLQVTAKLIRRSIEVVSERAARGDRSADLCRGVLKSVYAELLSGYLARSAIADSDDPLYRPDWRDHLKAEARCRLWYSLRALASAGCAPVAIATDAIFIPSDADTPGEALHGLLALGARPAQWAFKSRVALAEVAPAFSDRAGSCRALVAAVRAREALA